MGVINYHSRELVINQSRESENIRDV